MRLLVNAATGAIIGVATGFAVYAVSNSASSAGIIVWPVRADLRAIDAILWAILGAVVAIELSDF